MTEPTDKNASEELKEAMNHLFAAARKVAKNMEPHVAKPLEDAERVLDQVGRGGEAALTEVAREMASLTGRLADKLREVADRHPDPKDPPAEK